MRVNCVLERRKCSQALPALLLAVSNVAPIDAKAALFNQNIWLAGVETMRPIISEGTSKSAAIRPMELVVWLQPCRSYFPQLVEQMWSEIVWNTMMTLA
jgi:hypothetical protein